MTDNYLLTLRNFERIEPRTEVPDEQRFKVESIPIKLFIYCQNNNNNNHNDDIFMNFLFLYQIAKSLQVAVPPAPSMSESNDVDADDADDQVDEDDDTSVESNDQVTTATTTAPTTTQRDAKLVVAWLTTSARDAFESFAMEFLAGLLLNGTNAPLYAALIESGRASTFTNTGYDDRYHREAPFSVGLSGVNAAEANQLEHVCVCMCLCVLQKLCSLFNFLYKKLLSDFV